MIGRGLLQRLLCVAVQLALLAPLSLGLRPMEERRCLCGMKAGACHCDLMAHTDKGPCGGMAKAGARSRCSLSNPRSPLGEAPQVSLDVRDRLAVLRDRGLAPHPDLEGVLTGTAPVLPISLAPSPESPPPRLSFLVA